MNSQEFILKNKKEILHILNENLSEEWFEKKIDVVVLIIDNFSLAHKSYYNDELIEDYIDEHSSRIHFGDDAVSYIHFYHQLVRLGIIVENLFFNNKTGRVRDITTSNRNEYIKQKLRKEKLKNILKNGL